MKAKEAVIVAPVPALGDGLHRVAVARIVARQPLEELRYQRSAQGVIAFARVEILRLAHVVDVERPRILPEADGRAEIGARVLARARGEAEDRREHPREGSPLHGAGGWLWCGSIRIGSRRKRRSSQP